METSPPRDIGTSVGLEPEERFRRVVSRNYSRCSFAGKCEGAFRRDLSTAQLVGPPLGSGSIRGVPAAGLAVRNWSPFGHRFPSSCVERSGLSAGVVSGGIRPGSIRIYHQRDANPDGCADCILPRARDAPNGSPLSHLPAATANIAFASSALTFAFAFVLVYRFPER